MTVLTELERQRKLIMQSNEAMKKGIVITLIDGRRPSRVIFADVVANIAAAVVAADRLH